MRTVSQLLAYAQKFTKETWNKDFNSGIFINSRLSRARARFCVRANRQFIDFQPDVLTHDSIENIEKTLKHELCHWYLYNTKPGQHRDGHPTFERLLKEVGSHSTRTVGAVGTQYICKCNKCGKDHHFNSEKSARKRATPMYTTRCCRAFLTYHGVKVISRATETAAEIAVMAKPDVTPVVEIITGQTLTAAQLASQLKMDDKTLRRKLRNAGFQKSGSEWSFTPSMVMDIKKKFGL